VRVTRPYLCPVTDGARVRPSEGIFGGGVHVDVTPPAPGRAAGRAGSAYGAPTAVTRTLPVERILRRTADPSLSKAITARDLVGFAGRDHHRHGGLIDRAPRGWAPRAG
jgi:hypothetical protein